MNPSNPKHHPLKRQTGAVLVISLVMLLLLTLIGISGTQMTTLEQRMATNAEDQNIAFQAAEAAMMEAERLLKAAADNNLETMNFTVEGIGGYYAKEGSVLDSTSASTDAFWRNNPSIAYSGPTLAGVNPESPPRYAIQFITDLPPDPPDTPIGRCVYNIFVWATGGTSNAVVVLQLVKITKQNPNWSCTD